MTLDNLLRIGKLKPHLADRTELARLLAAAQRAVEDAAIRQLSADARLDLVYRAIMQIALAALLANGYRPATSEPGHHQLIVQALAKTAGIATERVRVLDGYRAARNQSDYRGVPVSDAIANECLADARGLLRDVKGWLAAHRSDLCGLPVRQRLVDHTNRQREYFSGAV